MTEFAELVGGECAVESSPGKGTLVLISLPAVDASGAHEDAGRGTEGSSKG
ncbi:hypothetical protein [Sinorhizobium psoraleae]|uniref:Uncharacterized protein n=1 Tax=Sinorhizobium psoraleae TaxID=520838 RepID=A0ABT4KDW0_9HYPH|nr:hypothetical protein [Sinorhizobium psoraleae]MCZ4089187.1 hypothetical protein [Sinorhizobium psoraleae]